MADFGAALAVDHPEQTRHLVAGSTLELTGNLLDTASAILGLMGKSPEDGPFALGQGQNRAFEAAQRLISRYYPDLVEKYRRSFEELHFPISGFGDVTRITQSAEVSMSPDQSVVRILHIADLHRTPDEAVTNENVRHYFEKALDEIDDSKLDLIVIAGDLTQTADETEYKEAEVFIKCLVNKYLGGDIRKCIMVPGNHDISWSLAQGQHFKLIREIDGTAPPQMPGVVCLPSGWIVPTDSVRSVVTQPFCELYKRLTGVDYCGGAYIEPPGMDLGIITLDTTNGMHHFNDEAHVSLERLLELLKQATTGLKGRTLIAVGHHGPIKHKRQHDAICAEVFETLLVSGVRLYLHGHDHESGVSYFSDGDSRLPCVRVGSLVAGPKHRPESTGRQYNLIELSLERRTAKVAVRRKDTPAAKWRPDVRFGPPKTQVDYVRIVLP
jgi:Icc-related predicted phosphoesterase